MTLVRRRLLASIALGIVVLALALIGPRTSGGMSAEAAAPARYHYWLPPAHLLREPLPVLVVLHGMGSNGPLVAQSLAQEATDRGWLVVAPTFRYGNWQDPGQIAREDPALSYQLVELLDGLPAQIGFRTRPRAEIFGFSRGAQLAHRFAFFYPERVSGVFALSAGTYTIPWLSDGKSRLDLPYGLGNAESVLGRPLDWNGMLAERFVIAVGGNDTRSTAVPRQWDRLLGTNRLERAWTFHRILSQGGFQAQLQIYEGVGHSFTPSMQERVIAFGESLLAEEARVSGDQFPG